MPIKAVMPRRRRPRSSDKPKAQEPGRTFTAEVTDLASDGRGVVRHPDGRVCFVPGVWPGEEGRFQIIEAEGRLASAELIELIRPHPARRDAPCVFHGHSDRHCGGCPWQFMTTDAQLEVKQAKVEAAFSGLCDPAAVLVPIRPSPKEWQFRNRAQFKTDGEKLGYLAARSHHLVDVDDCPILTEPNRHSLAELRAQLPKREWRPGRKQRWTTLDIDDQTPGGQASVNTRLPFRQGNSGQNRFMQQWLAEQLAPLNKSAPVLELFCGSGNFTQVIAAAGFQKIVAAEGDEQALEKLQALNLDAVQTHAANLFNNKSLAVLLHQHPDIETLVLDPPRDGLPEREAMLDTRRHNIQTILYISCDLASAHRDIADFVSAGYKLEQIQPVDQFPHTPHIELLAALKKQ